MPADPGSILLSTTVTVAAYREMEAQEDKRKIAAFIKQRFTERYITSLSQERNTKNGFAMTAVACLMIEALESFWQGWPHTKQRGRGLEAFRGFFERHSQFSRLVTFSDGFYTHVRCGILHQAETTGGWRIRRDGELFDAGQLKINAVKLVAAIKQALDYYCAQLSSEAWNSEIWMNLRKKMRVVCDNAVGSE